MSGRVRLPDLTGVVGQHGGQRKHRDEAAHQGRRVTSGSGLQVRHLLLLLRHLFLDRGEFLLSRDQPGGHPRVGGPTDGTQLVAEFKHGVH